MTTQARQRQQSFSETGLPRFKPETESERLTAQVTRMMLYYHIIRVQLDAAVPDLTDGRRLTLRHYAIALRRGGFLKERDAQEKGLKVSYDDEMLRREGTRIAYSIARGEIEAAMLHEEEVVARAVGRALYDNEDEAIKIAA